MEDNKFKTEGNAILQIVTVLVVVNINSEVFGILLPKCRNAGNKIDSFYRHAAVASDAKVCSDIGVEVMKENGTAVEAAVASMICLGLIHPHSSGIGGGGFMLVYENSKKEAKFFDFREMAPGASTVDMFLNKTKESVEGKEIKIKL